ncbi:hypothetical protein BOW52_10675 [Solemya elarraichensis gill symbiont]|uniref:ATP-grasp fold RimK-type domain-containing protein n=1 Tax=Solemya elarraichensis gill symbiont TaxID=1918949 RepID=A0A1T2KUX7_9GAMM|nr:hypothetical protein BOW52_10675 [Solemya elarraichensis gill symbiont]
MLEKHFEGISYRLTVCNGELANCTMKLPAGVTGDGKHTIRQLVALERNEAQNNKRLHAPERQLVSIDTEAEGILRSRGLSSDSIPDRDVFIPLKGKTNATAGGKTIRLKHEEIHPDNTRLAIETARLLRLDIAGIDLIIKDISQSWLQSGGLICEVNAIPQMGPKAIRRMMEKMAKEDLTTPFHLVIHHETGMEQEAIRKLAHETDCNAWCDSGSIWINDIQISNAIKNSFMAANALLSHTISRSILCVMAEDEIKQFGLPVYRPTSISFMQKTEDKKLVEMLKQHTDTVLPDIELQTCTHTHCI